MKELFSSQVRIKGTEWNEKKIYITSETKKKKVFNVMTTIEGQLDNKDILIMKFLGFKRKIIKYLVGVKSIVG